LLRGELDEPIKKRDFTVPSGSQVFGPPYDREWEAGSGVGSHLDGTFSTSSSRGDSVAGVGFYLSSPEPLLANVTPGGDFSFIWRAFADLPLLQSRGGLGVQVYANGIRLLILEATLWSLSGVMSGAPNTGTGQIADAVAIPASGIFGPTTLGPIGLLMDPGTTYVFWVYCWQTMLPQGDSDNPFLAALQVKMPFVTVRAAPPPPL
jgi:hypothetical protein